MYLLDSSAIIEITTGTSTGKKILKICKNVAVFTTPFSIFEVLYGSDKEEESTIKKFFDNVIIANFDKNSALRSVSLQKDLEKEGKLINKVDIFISSIAIENRLKIITLDKDFTKIKNLDLYLL